ncbi:plasmid mobilization relaxosome protein MobC [Caulobacter soli]|uniref:plasmid mobilization relaxosome protein MobC n=1 Tax=Caulobacter soli TaxID=2708539 RepID=UPI00196AB9D9|nr:plasmid mobilization relaxosome protein MobC [Caulobacter soli]
MRLTHEERARLERDAVGMALGAYIKWRVFNPDKPPPRVRGKAPVKDHLALTKLMGLLGQSRIANNLNQLARGANTGTLPVTEETEAALLEAVRDVAELRRLLIAALGLGDEL